MKNWPVRKLGELTTVISSGATPLGGSENYSPLGDVMFIRSQNVLMNSLQLDNVAFVSDSIDSQLARTRIQFGDVLLNITGASIGRVAVFDLNSVRANVNQHVCVIRPRASELSSAFLSRFISTPSFQLEIGRIQAGGTRQALNFTQIANFAIPMPPLEEQRRIATILEKGDALREKRRLAIKKLDSLTQSIFLDMFGACGGQKVELGALAEIRTGGTPSRASDSFYGGGIPWVKTTEVHGSEILSTEETLTLEGLRNSNCRLFPKGSIVIAMYGQGRTRGQCALLGIDSATNQACAVILPNDRYVPRFLLTLLKSKYQELRSLARGGNQANLNLDLIRRLVINLPPIEAQCRFDVNVSKILGIGKKLTASCDAVDKLFASSQHSAFRGEL